MADDVSGLLIVAGALFLVLGAVGAALPPSGFVRLHYLSLSTMLGAPLVLVGCVVRDPADWFKLLFIAVLLAASSPVAGAATARALHRAERGTDGA